MRIVGLIVAIFLARWVWQDANQLKSRGANLTPGLWATLTVLACALALPIYLVMKKVYYEKQASSSLVDPKVFD